jgi:protein involved in polysaccharide export with SLBB domain
MTHKLLHAWRRMFSFAVVVTPVILVALLIFALVARFHRAEATSAPSAETESSSVSGAATSAESSSSRDLKLHVGDRVTVTFFEKLAVDQNAKWAASARSRRPLQNFYQRTELSGTFAVESDGNIVIPLLGPIPVADRTLREFEEDVSKLFEQRIGQFGFINVAVQHRDIYVLGPVERPGTFAFTRGMTVWHAVALAGGFDRMSVDMSRLMQAIGEAEKQQRYSQIARKLWAKAAVLRAESRNQEVEIPPRLVELTGLSQAKALIDEELEVRRLRVEGVRGQLSALDISKQAAAAELERKQALVAEIAKAIPLQEQRAADLTGLADRKSVSTTLRINAEASLSAAKERHITALIAVEEAQSRLGKLENDRAKLENDTKLALSQEVIKVHQELDEAEIALKSSSSTLDAMRAAITTGDDNENDGVVFDVVRKSGRETSAEKVPGTFELQPGDLVRVRTLKSKSAITDPPAASQ